MKYLPYEDIWIGRDAEHLIPHIRAWRTVIKTLIGPRSGGEVEIEVHVYLQRAIFVMSMLDVYEPNLQSDLSVQQGKIAEDLEWILEHVSQTTRNMMLMQYQNQLVLCEFEEMLDDFQKLKAAKGIDSPEVQQMRQRLIGQGDQIDTIESEYLRALLDVHPDAIQRLPQDIKDQLNIEDELDHESKKSD